MVLAHEFFFQAEDGIRDLVRSRGLGDVYKRQPTHSHNRKRRSRGENSGAAAGSFMAKAMARSR